MTNTSRQSHESTAALVALTDAIAAIEEWGRQVAAIVGTINEIAFATNLFARNATVEGARAGDMETGFAVVAQEVRTLAQRAVQAARDTAALVETSIASAEHGLAKVGDATQAISEIADTVSRMDVLIREVSQSSRQQTQEIDQVSKVVAHMERVTETAAATAKASAAASERLNAQALVALSVVGELETLSGGSRSSRLRPKTVPIRERRRGGRVAPPSKSGTLKPKESVGEASPLPDTGTTRRS